MRQLRFLKPGCSRRVFLQDSIRLAAALPLLHFAGTEILRPKNPQLLASITVNDVIEEFLKEVTGAPFTNTVDTIKSGDPATIVKGIVTTMFATHEVILKSIDTGANFIIAHEPTFYNHLDDTEWLRENDVYDQKQSLLDKNKMVVWRCHDTIHRHVPDGVLMGVIEALDWRKYYDPAKPHMLRCASATLAEITRHVQKSLGIPHLKVIGKGDQVIKNIALLPGAAGGNAQISVLQKEQPNLLIVGEINEWETAEYMRDAQQQGKNFSLIVLGHAVSEEPGMKWMADWLRNKYATLKIQHIPSSEPFRYT